MAKYKEIAMPQTKDSRHQEAVDLTRAIEMIFRKLAKFLIGRMSLIRLQEIIKYIFVEEIENKLRKENPTKNVPLTQLALLSGLDTRTLTKIRNSSGYRQPFHREFNFLKNSTPGASILDAWGSKAPYVDEHSGEPKPLKISGDTPSFESLFEANAKSRGVTYVSLLNRMIEGGSISIDTKKSTVSLVTKSYLPSESNDKLGAIGMGFSALGNMVDTITRNIISIESGKERFYQRGAWTFRLNESNKEALRSDLKILLENTDSKARTIIEKYEEKFPSAYQITAGISSFYFEESIN
jgi:hypothetical protein